jgi:hypothetical protein
MTVRRIGQRADSTIVGGRLPNIFRHVGVPVSLASRPQAQGLRSAL